MYSRYTKDRKGAGQSKAEGEARYRSLFDNSPDAVLLTAPDGRNLSANAAACAMFQMSEEKICALCRDELIDKSDERHAAAARELNRTGKIHRRELRWVRGDGSIFPAEVSSAILENGSGVFVYLKDITDSKKTERAAQGPLEEDVRRGEANLRRLFENIREMVAVFAVQRDEQGRITRQRLREANPAFLRAAGVSSIELVRGKTSEEVFGKSWSQSLFPALQEAMDSGVARKQEVYHPESRRYYLTSIVALDSNSCLVTGRDITERKQREQELGRSRDALELLVRQRTEELAATNRAHRQRAEIIDEQLRKADRAYRTLSECNQAMVRETDEMELFRQVCRIMVEIGGYRMAWVGFAENDAGRSLRPVVSAGHDNGYLDQVNVTWADTERGRGPAGTSVRTGKMAVSQNAFTNPLFAPWRSEAIKRGYGSSISLPLIVEGKVIGALTVYACEPDAFDEAEAGLLAKLADNLSFGVGAIRLAQKRRRSEQALRTYASRLETTNAQLQEFAFVASHDLQEPLRKIQTFCDLAVKNCSSGLGAKTEDYLERLANSAGRMRQLLHDLLEFSKIMSGEHSFAAMDLAVAVREAADVFDPLIRETGCRLDIDELPCIEADHSQMIHLFQNLIGNSLKYRGDEMPHIKICGALAEDGFCKIVVEDNGIGFDGQYCDLIFKPFQRLHKRGEYSGTGMGLSICRKIVERHGGTISANGEPGKGAVFAIRLPLKQAKLEGVNVDQES